MKTKQVFSDKQIKQALGEQNQQVQDILETTYTASDQVADALESYVEVSSDKLRQAQNYGEMKMWATDTETFLKEKVSELLNITQSIVTATKELQK